MELIKRVQKKVYNRDFQALRTMLVTGIMPAPDCEFLNENKLFGRGMRHATLPNSASRAHHVMEELGPLVPTA